MGLLFKLLENFAEKKDYYASVVYKTISFALLENYNNPEITEFILRNFKDLFERNSNIPIGILLEPYVKQIQQSKANG